MEDLKERAIRGGLAKLTGQGASLLLRVGTLAVLARLLSPNDFGIVAMMTVVTGFFDIISSAGLTPAVVQCATITEAQRTKLFWINAAFGVALAGFCLMGAPLLADFYGEPRLAWVAPAFAVIFLLNGLGVQQQALLERELRFVATTRIELTAHACNAAVAVAFAWAGFGYWALIFGLIVQSAIYTWTCWMATGWIPGLPERGVSVGPLLRFGATVTLNNMVVFLAYNIEKMLIGRYWGAASLGIYGRAYQLINIPTQSINSAVAGVALSALSRLQHDPVRQRRYFVKGYSLLMSLTMPVTVFCALFGADIILVMLGPQWTESVPVFRLLTPTVLIFGMINPLWSLLLSSGLQNRSLYLALVICPLVLGAVALGVPYGPTGVAAAFSTAMALWVVPHILWSLKGTSVRPLDLAKAAGKPFLSAVVGGLVAFVISQNVVGIEWPILRLALYGATMAVVYYGMLLFVLGEGQAYLDLLRGFGIVRNRNDWTEKPQDA
jgi:O-antigen/teichoic acid export membrane protein